MSIGTVFSLFLSNFLFLIFLIFCQKKTGILTQNIFFWLFGQHFQNKRLIKIARGAPSLTIVLRRGVATTAPIGLQFLPRCSKTRSKRVKLLRVSLSSSLLLILARTKIQPTTYPQGGVTFKSVCVCVGGVVVSRDFKILIFSKYMK